jgi:hypothetical protein
MRQILAATALTLAIATPALAQTAMPPNPYAQASRVPHGDPQIQGIRAWEQEVAQGNADRLNAEQQEPAPQQAAVSNGATATDAAAGQASQPAKSSTSGAAGYGIGLRARGGCPGTNAAGGPWQPGEYCLPGGR